MYAAAVKSAARTTHGVRFSLRPRSAAQSASSASAQNGVSESTWCAISSGPGTIASSAPAHSAMRGSNARRIHRYDAATAAPEHATVTSLNPIHPRTPAWIAAARRSGKSGGCCVCGRSAGSHSST